MSLPVFTWVLDHSEERLGNRLTLLALAEHAHDDGSKSYPAVATLVKRTRLSERQVQNCLKSLQENGAIIKIGVSPRGVNVYKVVGPFNGEYEESAGVQILPVGPVGDCTPGVSKIAPEPSENLHEEHVTTSSTSQELADLGRVRATWLAAPGMLQHRESYFTEPKLQRAVRKAIARYGIDDVCAAIVAYAEVVASPTHFFKHRWTLIDFLGRGLDRFVPEADPRTVFVTGHGAAVKPSTEYAADIDFDAYNKGAGSDG